MDDVNETILYTTTRQNNCLRLLAIYFTYDI